MVRNTGQKRLLHCFHKLGDNFLTGKMTLLAVIVMFQCSNVPMCDFTGQTSNADIVSEKGEG